MCGNTINIWKDLEPSRFYDVKFEFSEREYTPAPAFYFYKNELEEIFADVIMQPAPAPVQAHPKQCSASFSPRSQFLTLLLCGFLEFFVKFV